MTEAVQRTRAAAGAAAADRVAAVLERHTGMRVQSAQRHRLDRAIAGRMRALGEESRAGYADRVERDSEEWRRLIPEVAVGETRFFRELERWDAIERQVIPDLIARRGGRLLHLWSAGCATGQEAYGLAMVCERLRERYPGLKADIVGTDINRDALEVARRAEYSESAMRGLSSGDRLRFFEPAAGGHRVRPAVQASVRFEELNLLAWAGRPHTGRGYDLILCQRVLIYLSAPATERILAALASALEVGGVLLLGHTETIAPPPGCGPEWLGGSHAFRRMPLSRPAPEAEGAPADPDPTERIRLAWEAAIAERYADAQAQLAGLARTGEALRLMAWVRIARGEPEAAARLVASARSEAPDHPEPYFLEGLLALARGRPEEAAATFKRAAYLDPGFAPAQFHLAELAAAAGRRGEARRAWQAAEREAKGDAERIRRYFGFDAAAFAQVCRSRRGKGEDGGG
jgi:chemotaxis protein methyltransferase CheR